VYFGVTSVSSAIDEQEEEWPFEGVFEENELTPSFHGADADKNGIIGLSELLRVIQFFNMGGFQCATDQDDSEDGYVAGAGSNHNCLRHGSDYGPQDWQISLTELLRLIQFFNIGGYVVCPDQNTEDGYCPIAKQAME